MRIKNTKNPAPLAPTQFIHECMQHIEDAKGKLHNCLENTVIGKEHHITTLQTKVAELEDTIKEKDIMIRNLQEMVREREAEIEDLKAGLEGKEAALNNIYNSYGWKALLIYYKLRNKIFPINSLRRRVAKFIWNFFGKILKLVRG